MVHCLAGVSRSVSLVLAFLIKHQGFSYNQAFDFVKSRRKIIHPNDGFIQQLKKF
jgi:protein-tyrosine phosphatase